MSTKYKCKKCLDICKCCSAEKCSECRPFGSKFGLKICRCRPKQKFNPGDRVRVRNDLVVGNKYKMYNDRRADGCIFTLQMAPLLGEYVTITEYLPGVNRYSVSFNGVNSTCLWTDEMFDGNLYLPF